MKRQNLNLTNWIGRIGAISLAVMVMIGFPSCSSDDDGDEEITVPEITDITSIEAGKSLDVNFTTNATWTLSSDKPWCTVSPSTGGAGTNKVSIAATDAGLDFTAQTALLTLSIGEKSTTFKVTRDAKIRQIKFYSDEGVTEITTLPIAYNDIQANYRVGFYVSANFDCVIDMAKLPVWILHSDDIKNLTVKADAAASRVWLDGDPGKFEVGAGVGAITFSDTKVADSEFTLALTTKTDNNFIYSDIVLPVTFTKDGFVKNGEVVTESKSVAYNLYAAKPNFTYICVGMDPSMMTYGGSGLWEIAWIGNDDAEDDDAFAGAKAPVSGFKKALWVQKNSQAKRMAAVFCLPDEVYNSFNDNSEMFEDIYTIKDKFVPYLLGTVIQETGVEVEGISFSGIEALEDFGSSSWGLTIHNNKAAHLFNYVVPAETDFRPKGEYQESDGFYMINEWLSVKVQEGKITVNVTANSGERREKKIEFIWNDWNNSQMDLPLGSLIVTQDAGL